MQPAQQLSLARHVDAVCDRFEADWRAGQKPRIEDYLAKTSGAQRGTLLRALLGVEIELRHEAGETVDADPYRERFPSDVDSVTSAFDEVGRARAARDTSDSRESVRTGKLEVRTDSAASAVSPIPKQIGRFPVTSVLGTGAFGRVYRAKDPQLGRDVAIKVPLPSAVASRTDRERFLREARAAAALHHPNICPVHEVGEEAGNPFIVMGFVPGQSLAAVLKARSEPLPEKQAAVIIRKLALALDAAHKKGIVHRDLKPANVMFDKERKDVVVTDFGLARAPRLGDAQTTREGVIMGTPAYMSPEQARGDTKAVGPLSDQYSLGVVLYEMLAGRRPFAGSLTEVIGQVLHTEPEPLSKHRPGVDPRLEEACRKAMAKDASARFSSMKDFAAAVETVLRSPADSNADTAKIDKTQTDAELSMCTDSKRLADIFEAVSAQHKEETAAVIERGVRRARTPRWVFAVGWMLLIGLAVLSGIVFFTRFDKVKVTIELTDVDLSDKSLGFLLDEEPISAETLSQPVELKPGEHVLVVKRGNTIIKRILLTVKGGWRPGIKMKEITPPSPHARQMSNMSHSSNRPTSVSTVAQRANSTRWSGLPRIISRIEAR